MNHPQPLRDLHDFLAQSIPYWRTLGIELKEVERGKAVFEASVRADLMQHQVLHGGVLASIADSACAVAAISMIYPENYATTINLQVSYLKPLLQGRFRAEGRCVKAGRNVLFSEANVFDQAGALVGTCTSQLLVVPWTS
jgi:uncharacterized protein (TIGR00369 family)